MKGYAFEFANYINSKLQFNKKEWDKQSTFNYLFNKYICIPEK